MINWQINLGKYLSILCYIFETNDKDLSFVFVYQCFLDSTNEVIQELTRPLLQILPTYDLFKIMYSKTL